MTQSVTHNIEGKNYTYTVGDMFRDKHDYGRTIKLTSINGKDMYFDSFLGENSTGAMYFSHAFLRDYFNPIPKDKPTPEKENNTINTLPALNDGISMEISVNLVNPTGDFKLAFNYEPDGECLVNDGFDYISFHVDDIDNLICALNRIKDIHKENQ